MRGNFKISNHSLQLEGCSIPKGLISADFSTIYTFSYEYCKQNLLTANLGGQVSQNLRVFSADVCSALADCFRVSQS